MFYELSTIISNWFMKKRDRSIYRWNRQILLQNWTITIMLLKWNWILILKNTSQYDFMGNKSFSSSAWISITNGECQIWFSLALSNANCDLEHNKRTHFVIRNLNWITIVYDVTQQYVCTRCTWKCQQSCIGMW